MTYRLKITDEAADRLLSTAKWYADTSQSLEVASAWYDGFLDELETLEQKHVRKLAARFRVRPQLFID